MRILNQRSLAESEKIRSDRPIRKHQGLLSEFPDERFEAVIIQWELFHPTVLIQLKEDPAEPVQFPGKRPQIPGNSELPAERAFRAAAPLTDFINPATGEVFVGHAFEADILFSARAFSLVQPGRGLVLPPEVIWECRHEALAAVNAKDEPLEFQSAEFR